MRRRALFFFAVIAALFMLVPGFGLRAAPAAPAKAGAGELWWSYLASYDDGPGSIRLDLNRYRQAPRAEYTHLLVTGTRFASSQPGGLPEPGDVQRLELLSNRTFAAIRAVAPAIFAGSFTHGGEQQNYIYVKNTISTKARIDKALAVFYAGECAGCKVRTNYREDASWSAYRSFLFPNLQTREFYREPLKAIGFVMPLAP
ncbi:MAG TPA: DUF695 domain-containing protein [Usitatibacteraceae bacterium]